MPRPPACPRYIARPPLPPVCGGTSYFLPLSKKTAKRLSGFRGPSLGGLAGGQGNHFLAFRMAFRIDALAIAGHRRGIDHFFFRFPARPAYFGRPFSFVAANSCNWDWLISARPLFFA